MGAQFVPILIELPDVEDPTSVKLRFAYSASIPESVDEIGEGTFDSPWSYSTGNEGDFRLWKKDASDLRTKDDFIKPEMIYSYEDLKFETLNGRLTAKLYVEAISASSSLADKMIRVGIDPDGDAGPVGFAFWDSARITAVDLSIAFDDRSGESKFTDTSSSKIPHPFWINNDFDNGDHANRNSLAATDTSSAESDPDWQNTSDTSLRDLEDFLAFQINVSLANKLGEDFVISLTYSGNSDALHIYRDNSGTVGSDFLRDQATAFNTLGSMKLVSGGFFSGLSDGIQISLSEFKEASTIQYLLEAARASEGKLKIELKKKSNGFMFGASSTLVGVDQASLKTSDVDTWYQHYTVGNTVYAYPQPYVPIHSQYLAPIFPPIASTTASYSGASVADNAERDSDYIVFVHGWRMLPEEREAYAETSLKRLFWEGSFANFVLFSWPTDWVDNMFKDPGT